jgi:type VI secretion system secreted protein VgrG
LPYTQIDRPFRLKTQLGDDILLLESFQGYERVSTPYRFLLRVLSENPNIDMKALLYKPAVMSLVLEDNSERHIHGNVKRMRLVEFTTDNLAAYEIELVPWFWFLNLFTDCRIFQNKSVKEIAEQVFQDRGFSDFEFKLQGSYPKRDYCVQYRETDFNFISRLLEEEGIFYYFKHDQGSVKMVLTDAVQQLENCPKKTTARYTPAAGGRLDDETIYTFIQEYQVHTGKTRLKDFDFEKPATDLSAQASGQQKGQFYDYPGGYLTKGDGDRYARIRLEERESQLNILHGDSNCRGLLCGFKFTLEDHFRNDLNTEYVVAAIEHNGRNPSYQSNQDLTVFEYTNKFECIPATTPFRPPRLARRPVIEGIQTALVVGPSGEEIFTDKYGRVKVQFHWDREGQADENSSCWIRVAHQWAGKKWGAIYLPRIGQEVIVTFLEGDPDRPLITGRVYNQDQMPPYDLPGEQTKSTLKSMSSKGGEGFNELRFEDKKGSEQIFMHAEKDLDVRVKNDREEWIGNNRSLIVTKDKYEKIGADEHNTVASKRIEKIGADHLLEIGGKQGIKITGDHSLSVTGNVVEKFTGNQSTEVTQNVLIKGLQIVIEASVGLTLKVGGNFVTIDPSGVAVKGVLIQLNSAGAALSGSPGQAVSTEKPKDPVEADNDKPGGKTPAPAAQIAPLESVALEKIAPKQRAGAQEDVPDRPVPAPGAGGRSRSQQPEYSTFPKNVDPVAVAGVLQDASQSGVPFCEECEKARQPAGTA